MPWFPVIEAARAIARTGHQDRHDPRPPFFDGLRSRDPDELTGSFAGDPVVDGPRQGHVEGREAFVDHAMAVRAWLLESTAGSTEPIRVTETAERVVEEVSVKLDGDHPELPVAAFRFSSAPSPTTASRARSNTTASSGGKDAIPPQAGVAVYERGTSGRLAAARIYDDVTPPESSDSSVQGDV